MLALRRRWAGLSILNKAIVLSCTFVIPILLVVGLLLNDFYAYRKESDRILSEYVLCTDYMDAVENEMSLLGEMTFAAPGSVELEDYADACRTRRSCGSGCGRRRAPEDGTARCCGRSSAA